MNKIHELKPVFVKFIPDELEDGVIYVSMEFSTAIHKCCCGCGLQTVTPFHQDGWTMTADGDKVSLSPSIGNWQLPCRSHYFIKENKVEWC